MIRPEIRFRWGHLMTRLEDIDNPSDPPELLPIVIGHHNETEMLIEGAWEEYYSLPRVRAN